MLEAVVWECLGHGLQLFKSSGTFCVTLWVPDIGMHWYAFNLVLHITFLSVISLCSCSVSRLLYIVGTCNLYSTGATFITASGLPLANSGACFGFEVM